MSRVKLTYTFVDAIAQFTLWSFRTPATLDQRCANTCVTTQCTFNINQDVATWQANGDCFWILRSLDYSNDDVYQQGGLGSFPTEPTSPVTNGNIVPGFTGRFVAAQSVLTTSAATFATAAYTFPTIRNVSITMQTQNLLVRDTFGSYYPTLTEGDVRAINIKTPVDFILNLGTNIGATAVFWLKNVFLSSAILGDGQLRFDASYSDSRATTSSLAVRDELTMVIA